MSGKLYTQGEVNLMIAGIKEALRDEVQAMIGEGIGKPNPPLKCCPFCDESIQYPRELSLGKQVIDVLELLNEYPADYIWLGDGKQAIHSVSKEKLRMLYCARQYAGWLSWGWGLAERHPDPKKHGHYKINDLGLQFLNNEIMVPKKVWVRHATLITEDEMLTLKLEASKLVLFSEFQKSPVE